jgi:hypothetical protein
MKKYSRKLSIVFGEYELTEDAQGQRVLIYQNQPHKHTDFSVNQRLAIHDIAFKELEPEQYREVLAFLGNGSKAKPAPGFHDRSDDHGIRNTRDFSPPD